MSDTELTICQMVYDQAAATPPSPIAVAELPRPVAQTPAPTVMQRPVPPPAPPPAPAPMPPPPPPPPVVQQPVAPPPPPPAPVPTPRPEPMTPIPRPMTPTVIAPVIEVQPAPVVVQQPNPIVVQVPPPPMPRPMPPRPVPRVMMLEAEMEMEMTVEKTRHMPMVHTAPPEPPVVLPAEAPVKHTFPAMECPVPTPASCEMPMVKPAECAMPCEMPVVMPAMQTACVMPAPCVQAAVQTAKALPTLVTGQAPPLSSCLTLPYPTVRNIEKNDRYAKIILNLYAGRTSELTALMRYFYDSIAFGCQCPEAYEILEAIAICEMHHMEILAKLLCALGTPPKFYAIENGSPRWWSGNPCCITYASSLGIAILNAIEEEKKTIRNYSDAICQIDNDQIALLLRRIIMDEEHHIRLLTSLYERCVD